MRQLLAIRPIISPLQHFQPIGPNLARALARKHPLCVTNTHIPHSDFLARFDRITDVDRTTLRSLLGIPFHAANWSQIASQFHQTAHLHARNRNPTAAGQYTLLVGYLQWPVNQSADNTRYFKHSENLLYTALAAYGVHTWSDTTGTLPSTEWSSAILYCEAIECQTDYALGVSRTSRCHRDYHRPLARITELHARIPQQYAALWHPLLENIMQRLQCKIRILQRTIRP